jgi:DNA uptake protein ComE-like DNA-binding protein
MQTNWWVALHVWLAFAVDAQKSGQCSLCAVPTITPVLCGGCHVWNCVVCARAQPAKSHLPAPDERVDANHASVDDLKKVPGIKGTWAMPIACFRPYHAKNSLLDREVLTSEIYSRIKDCVVAQSVAQRAAKLGVCFVCDWDVPAPQQATQQNVEHRNKDQVKNRREEHAAHNRGSHRSTPQCACTGGKD